MSHTSTSPLVELRIARAYIKLLCLPEGQAGARMISIGRIGNREIRLIEDPCSESANPPLFWMELFDHDVGASIDSFACREIEDAVVAFQEFIACSDHSQEQCDATTNAPQD